jgi:hypothetical protein
MMGCECGLPGGPEGKLHGCATVCWFPCDARGGEACGSGTVNTKTDFTTEGADVTEKPFRLCFPNPGVFCEKRRAAAQPLRALSKLGLRNGNILAR